MKVIFQFIIFFACLPLASSQDCDLIRLTNQAEVDAFVSTYGSCNNIVSLELDGNDITSLEAMAEMEPLSGFLIVERTSLRSLDGLKLDENISGVRIQYNSQLINLSVLESVESIENDLYIYSNNSLQGVAGFTNLKFVQNLNIQRNQSLTNLDGFASIEEIGFLRITDNSSLSDCCGVIDGLTINVDDVNLQISGNMRGCSNRQELLNSCGVDGCFSSNLRLDSQEEVNSFSQIYRDCEHLESVYITGSDIVSLDSLYTLQSVDELYISRTSISDLDGLNIGETLSVLNIDNNDLLTDLSGFSNLEEITNRFGITYNDQLKTVEGFSGLKRLNNLYIYGNNELENLDGFANLERLSNDITIARNPKLTTCCSLAPHFESYLQYANTMNISDNAGECEDLHITFNSCGLAGCYTDNISLGSQEEVDNFPNLFGSCVSINRLTISGIDVEDLEALHVIEEVQSLTVMNTSLVDITTIPITESTDNISIYSNDLLQELSIFEGSMDLHDLNIRDNAALRNVDGLSELRNVDQLSISNNPRIVNIDGLENLTAFNRLTITSNSSLSSCCSLLSSFGESIANKSINIRDNDTGCRDLQDVLSTCDFEGCFSDRIVISNQSQIDDFASNFGNCSSVRSVYIEGRGIDDISGLSQLAEITQDLNIVNTSIESLDGLSSIYISGFVNIESNPDLVNIDSLSNLDPDLRSLYIVANSQLEDCCGVIDHIENQGSIRNLNIHSNKDGCKGVGDIFLTCGYDGCFTPDIVRIQNQNDIDNFKNNYGNCASIHELNITGRDITNFDGFAELEEITHTLSIWESSFQSLEGLEHINLDSVQLINITGTSQLSSLDGINFPQTIDQLVIGDLPQLRDLRNLRTVKYVNELNIRSLPLIQDLDGLVNLSKVQNLRISDMPLIDDLDELSNLIQLKTLVVSNNNMLQNLEGLVNVSGMEEMNISNNDLLSSCCTVLPHYSPERLNQIRIRSNASGCSDVADVLQTCEYDGCFHQSIEISSQDQIDKFVELFGNCDSISTLLIDGADINNLDGLSDIRIIGSQLTIRNTNLENLDALSELTVSGSFVVHNNTQLNSIQSIKVSSTNLRRVILTNNPLLSECCNLTTYIQNSTRFGYVPDFVNNADGCNGFGNILNSCGEEGCFATDHINLSNQEDIDNFVNSYGNCTTVKSLRISGSNVTNLDGLAGLSEVNEALSIESSSIVSLEGISHVNLDSINRLSINYNRSLQSIEGLDLPASIEKIVLLNLPSLTDLEPLASVRNVESFRIENLESISNFNGLRNLSRVQNFNIRSLPLLQDLSFLTLLADCNSLTISSNEALVDISGISNISNLEVLNIQYNASLSECCVLVPFHDSSHESNIDLTLYDNAAGCEDLRDMLSTCDYDGCYSNTLQLISQRQVDNVRSTYGNCPEIENLILFGSDQNDRITNLDSLINLEKITNRIQINHSFLENFDGLSQIDMSNVGPITIEYNDNLTSLEGLESIDSAGSVMINYNNLIQNLDGLDNLNHVSSIRIEQNERLESLSGLNLETVEVVSVFLNPILTDIESFNSIESISSFNLIGNPLLATCCSVIQNGNGETQRINANSNSEGCNNQSEIENYCLLEDCPDREIILISQAEVNNYRQDQPSCNNISSLIIHGQDITNLDSLIYIELVTDLLTIEGTSLQDLESISHLDLSSVSNFRFIDNQELTSLTSLSLGETIDSMIVLGNSSITSIGSAGFTDYANYIQINRNESLVEIPFFESISGADQVSIFDNINLDECCGLFEMIDRAEIGTLLLDNNGGNCSSTQVIREQCGYCEDPHISLNSQEEVDNFRRIYPSCTELTDLRISGENITNLDSLYYIRSIDVHTVTVENTSLTNLDGISHVSIDVDFVEILNNPLLESITLSDLDIRDDLRILENESLTNIDIPNLNHLSFIEIAGNSALIDLNGLEGIDVRHDIMISDNVSLSDISGLRTALDDGLDFLIIHGNSSLSDCCILEEYFTFEHPHEEINFDISANAQGCNSQEEIISVCSGEICQIDELVLTTQAEVDAFPSTYPHCHTISSLTLDGQDITNTDSLGQLRRINGPINISNTSIEYLSSLNQISFAEDITIENNAQLMTIRGFEGIPELLETLTIRNNDMIQDLSGVNFYNTIGAVIIDDNDLLTQIDDFNDLELIRRFELTNNASLSDCCLIEQLLSIGLDPENIHIEENAENCRTYDEARTACNLSNPCEFEDLRFTSQEEIDNFESDHPNCTNIRNIWVEGEDITSLESLSFIERIYGDVSIQSTSLISLAGLKIAREIYSIHISNNQSLEDLSPLNNVGATEARIIISNNASIVHLDALNNLTQTGDAISIHDNGSLASIDGLSNLSSLERFYAVDNPNLNECCFIDQKIEEGVNTEGMTIRNNAPGCNSLEDIQTSCDEGNVVGCPDIFLNSQQEVDNFQSTYGGCTSADRLFIDGTDIVDLDGLASLVNVADKISIYRTQLTDLLGLDHINLESLTTVDISGNRNMLSLEGINISGHVDTLEIFSNDMLEDLNALSSLTSVDQLGIGGNSSIEDLAGFEGLRTVDYLLLMRNSRLTDINALSNLSELTTMEIGQNESLADCCFLLPFAQVDATTIEIFDNAAGCNDLDDISVSCDEEASRDNCSQTRITLRSQADVDNFELDYQCNIVAELIIRGSDIENLDGLLSLATVTERIEIEETSLGNLTGLAHVNMTSLSGLEIRENGVLENLDGVTVRERMDKVIVSDNPLLLDIQSLEPLRTYSYFELNGNSILSVCCPIIPALDRDENGRLVLRNNAEVCNEAREIEEACADSSNVDCRLIVLQGQEEVDNFSTTYPGCISTNTLVIEGADIENLDGLLPLQNVNDGISFYETRLVDLMGINHINLETVKGVELLGNSSLQSLDGLNLNGHLDYFEMWFSDALEDISSFALLTSVGQFSLNASSSLQNLSGLEGLRSVEEYLSIVELDNLTDISALGNLSEVEGYVEIIRNESLSDCCVVLPLIQVDSSKFIMEENATGCTSNADIIEECQDTVIVDCESDRIVLRNQQEVDDFAVTYSGCQTISELIITGNDIVNLSGLMSIVRVTEKLEIEETSLGDLTGLAHIDMSSVSQLEIRENGVLDNLAGVTVSERMDKVIVSDNPLLLDIENLEPLRFYEYLEVYGNVDLSICCALLPALDHEDGRMVVRNNAEGCNGGSEIKDACDNETIDCSLIVLNSQQEVDNFSVTYSGCNSVDILHIHGDDIVDLDGLASLENVKEKIEVVNTQLENLQGLDHIIFESLKLADIVKNNNLESLEGLRLSGPTKVVSFYKNAQLHDLTALNSLRSVEYLEFVENNSLRDLRGLEELRIVKYLLISRNMLIADINSISNLNVIETLEVFQNESLSECCVLLPTIQESIDELYIDDNASGCNSDTEVEEVCTQEVDCTEVILISQADVDDFPTRYAGCTEIDILQLDGVDITDISPLSEIEKVNRELYIGSTQLTDLNGLAGVEFDSLEIVNIYDNDQLTTLNGVMFTSHVMEINIDDNDVLQDLNGLATLESVEHLGISFNNSLESVQGLEGLIAIEHLLITQNPKLSDINDLSSLEEISFGDIFENASLSDCCIMLPFVQEDNGPISVSDNAIGCSTSMEIRSECQDVEIVECEIDIVVFRSQQDVDDFQSNFGSCNSIRSLDISGSDITNLRGLADLARVTGYVQISKTGLENFDEIAHVDFDSTQYVIVRQNEELRSMAGISIGEHLQHIKINNNSELQDLSGLESLVTSSYLSIENNNSLIDLAALSNVTSVDRLTVTSNALLQSFSGLENLERVETFSAYFNPLLVNVDALAKLGSYDLLHINFNASLSECCGLMLVINSKEEDDYLRIGNNLPGCNSIEEVVDGCNSAGLQTDEITMQEYLLDRDEKNISTSFDRSQSDDHFMVYPNPFNDKLIVRKVKELNEFATISLYDIKGSLISKQSLDTSKKVVNTAGLTEGVYIIKIESASSVYTDKLIKR